MASVQQRPNGRWAVRWRDQDGRQRWRTFERRADAKQFCKIAEHSDSVPMVSEFPIALTSPTVDEFSTCWADRQLWRPSTRASFESHRRRHISPHLGPVPLDEIRSSHVQVWIRSLSDRLSAGTVQVIVSHLRVMLNDAVRDGLLGTNPVAGVRVPRINRTLVVPPTVEQLGELAARLPGRYRAIVAVCAGTGLRQGECFGLTLDRVDMETRLIRIDRQIVTVERNAPVFGPPKTSASVRTIPLADRTLDVIRQQAASYPNRLGLIFSNNEGKPIDRTRFSDHWRPVAASLGLPPRTGMHCLRHFYASMLIRAGCSVKVVQSRLGHATASETLDTYAHLWPDNHDQTRAAIDGLLL